MNAKGVRLFFGDPSEAFVPRDCFIKVFDVVVQTQHVGHVSQNAGLIELVRRQVHPYFCGFLDDLAGDRFPFGPRR